MQRKLLLVTAALLYMATGAANAETYKCSQNGKTVYSDLPCATNAARVDYSADRVTADQRRQAEIVHLKNQVSALQSDLEESRTKRIAQEQSEALAQASDQKKEAKERRCKQLLATAKAAKDEAAMYRYHQGLIDDARRREKEANDAHWSECYGWSGR